jgi:hypothetical protein
LAAGVAGEVVESAYDAQGPVRPPWFATTSPAVSSKSEITSTLAGAHERAPASVGVTTPLLLLDPPLPDPVPELELAVPEDPPPSRGTPPLLLLAPLPLPLPLLEEPPLLLLPPLLVLPPLLLLPPLLFPPPLPLLLLAFPLGPPSSPGPPVSGMLEAHATMRGTPKTADRMQTRARERRIANVSSGWCPAECAGICRIALGVANARTSACEAISLDEPGGGAGTRPRGLYHERAYGRSSHRSPAQGKGGRAASVKRRFHL